MNKDFARQQMIEQQVRAWEVLDGAVLASLKKVQRELFVPEGYEALAFADTEIPIGHGADTSSSIVGVPAAAGPAQPKGCTPADISNQLRHRYLLDAVLPRTSTEPGNQPVDDRWAQAIEPHKQLATRRQDDFMPTLSHGFDRLASNRRSRHPA